MTGLSWSATAEIMGRALAFLKKELLEMLPPVIFFLVVFHVVVFTRSLMEAGSGVSMIARPRPGLPAGD